MTGSFANNSALAPLFADTEIATLFDTDAQVGYWIEFEAALTRALGDQGIVDTERAEAALVQIESFEPDMALIGLGTLTDGLPVPSFVRQLKAHVGPDLLTTIHAGATSQDLIDTGLILALREVNRLLEARLAQIIEQLETLDETFGENPMMARTRMQAALPIRVSDRLITWRHPLQELSRALDKQRKSIEHLQFGGAVGTGQALGDKARAVADQLATHFALGNPPKAWHSMRSPISSYGNWLSELTGSLGKMGMDICLMAQQGVAEVKLSGTGTSSAMPHKQNPVLAELLVTFARFNATQLSALHHSLIHEQERSGMAWTLEWMILPQMTEISGKALLHATQLLSRIEHIGMD